MEEPILWIGKKFWRMRSVSSATQTGAFAGTAIHMECRLIERSDPLEVVLITDFVDTVQNERLATALRQLTDRQRRMIELAYWEGYPLKDIAVIMNCKPNTVSQLISRAKRHLYIALTR